MADVICFLHYYKYFLVTHKKFAMDTPESYENAELGSINDSNRNMVEDRDMEGYFKHPLGQ